MKIPKNLTAASFTLLIYLGAGVSHLCSAIGPDVADPKDLRLTLGTTRFRNYDAIRTMALSPSGKLLATAGGSDPTWETSILIWNLETGKLQQRLMGHTFFVDTVAFLSEDTLVSCSASERTMRKWTLGKEDSTILYVSEDPLCMTVSPDRKKLIIGTRKGELLTWGLNENKITRSDQFPTPIDIYRIAISPSGKLLACKGEKKNEILILEADTRKLIKKLTAGEEIVSFFDFSPDSHNIAASSSKSIRIWNLETGKETQKLSLPDKRYADEQPVKFSDDGKAIFAVWGNRFYVLSRENLRILKEVSTNHTRINSLITVPKNGFVIAAGYDQYPYFIDTANGLLTNPPVGHVQGICSASFAPDDATLWTSCHGGFIVGWELKLGKQIHKLQVHEYGAQGVAFISKDSFLSLASDKSIAVVKLDRKGLSVKRKQFDKSFFAIAGPLHNNKFLVASERSFLEYDHESGTLVEMIGKINGIGPIAISPNKRQLAFASDENVLLYGIANGKKPQAIGKHGDCVYGIAYSSDGKMLATACRDGTVAVWNTATGMRIRTYEAHDLEAKSVVFFANDRGLISAGCDGRIHFWALKLDFEKPLRTLESANRARIHVLSLSHDETMLAAGEEGGLVTLWDLRNTRDLLLGKKK